MEGNKVQNHSRKILPICIVILCHPPVWSLHGRNKQTCTSPGHKKSNEVTNSIRSKCSNQQAHGQISRQKCSVTIVFTQKPPNSPLPPSFSQESLMRQNTWILQRDKWFVVRTKGPWHKNMSKRSKLENHWTSWMFSFLDFKICQKDLCAATIEYHRPCSCHSCKSISVWSKGTESVSYWCLGQIDERWRWSKENKVLKSNDQRRKEKCQVLGQRDNYWGQRRVEMTWGC